MRVLLSTIGSRGDVQPLAALASDLVAQGHQVRLCVPPDFRDLIEGLGLPVVPIGPDVRSASRNLTTGGSRPSAERLRQLAEETIANQFETIAAAAADCDILVGATALQIAAPSVAERLGIPYVFAAFCPRVLPSPHHPPIPLGNRGEQSAPDTADNRELWSADARRWNDTWGALLNSHRAAAGLAPVEDVRSHIFTESPWLAADPTLGPWPGVADGAIWQCGAWILRDERPLAPDIERFLDAGDPPIYFGLGSMHAPRDLGGTMIQAARVLGRRAIVSRGWAELELAGDEPDALAIGEVNQQALFRRVAAIVHHGGAGTTTAAALGAAPQVVVPQMYDQSYWAHRVQQLGIGSAHAAGTPTVESLSAALDQSLRPDVIARAGEMAGRVRRDGARLAALRLTT